MSQCFFLKVRDETKQTIFMELKQLYTQQSYVVSRAPLPAKIISPQIVLSAYRDDPKSIRL